MPELLDIAAAHQVEFVHLRGGARGHHLADQSHDRLRRWAQYSARTVPVTAVTTDVDLADLAEDRIRPAALAELGRLCIAAELLASGGPTVLRVLARTPLTPQKVSLNLVPRTRVPVVIELHHPDWFVEPALPAVLMLIKHNNAGLGLLADSGQIHRAHTTHPGLDAEAVGRIVEHSPIVHLADDGTGLDAAGHRLLAAAVRDHVRLGWTGQVAFEWAGHDRRAQTCLARYDLAAAWWRRCWEGR